MKIFKLLGLTSILALSTVPFVLPTKHEVVRCAYIPLDSDLKETKEKVSNLEKKVDALEKKIDELEKVVYAFSKNKLEMFPITIKNGEE